MDRLQRAEAGVEAAVRGYGLMVRADTLRQVAAQAKREAAAHEALARPQHWSVRGETPETWDADARAAWLRGNASANAMAEMSRELADQSREALERARDLEGAE